MEAYEQLGDERVQQIPDVSRTVTTEVSADRGYFTSDTELFWSVRRDYNWSKLPGIFKFVRRTGKREFFETITSSLVHLEPATSFNPVDAWLAELARADEPVEKAEEKKKPKKKVDELRERNTAEQYAKRLHDEVVQIRNSKRDLMEIVGQIKLPQARAILLVQILATAYKQYEKNKDKRMLYEAHWALECMELPKERAPKVQDDKVILVKDPSLVYDNPASVDEIIAKARKVISSDSDLIRVQLVEMYDSLPPLSKFSFGFKLDLWQKRVLTWIDAGKSVVISAPTSSGKTVLSSYVAVIFKNKMITKADDGKAAKPAARKPAAAEEDGFANEDEEAEMAEEYEEMAAAAAEEDDVVLLKEPHDFTAELLSEDVRRRGEFLRVKKQMLKEGISATSSNMRVLFVVPTEPLVWQVAAYFTKLLREQGDRKTPVAIVTDQLSYNPQHKLNVMPQIVVGTPFALESALAKPRGLTGMFETKNKAAGDLIPGGFDHFDWVIYDEVHALDGAEGAALQRIIRSMNCRFLALSATVGNAQALRAWMEQVKGEQISDVETLTVTVPDSDPLAQVALGATLPNLSALKLDKAEDAKTAKVVTVVKTSNAEKWEVSVTAGMTVQQLKDAICAHWPDLRAEESVAKHVVSPIQVFHRGTDLVLPTCSLADYGLFAESPVQDGLQDVLYVPTRVHCLVHSTRFINLQRYFWDASSRSKGSLVVMSPLSAVKSVEDLQSGILHDSSLSFTSSDSYRVYEEVKKIYPAEAAAIVSPYHFFGASERITLQRVKDYEDLLKTGLQKLATQYPAQTQTLLDAFKVKDGAKEVDLCELILQLKTQDMLPCLPFHLNTFEAIRLFQQVVAGLEYRQKKAYPTYYMDLVAQKDELRKRREGQKKSTGGDSKKEEELERAGELESAEGLSVDTLAPHPNFLVCKGAPLSDKELEDLVHEMELYDGFDKRDNMQGANRGKNQEILQHALVRGLRRGVGLFIEEVSFPSYRRAVQRLASQGKLGVVISDSSLAFGVNMPFRTTVFCGEMRGALDELMAQQMSGRAGRRGLDTQGNIVYAGLRTKLMQKLMIGTVAHIHGVDSRQVKYDTLFLQAVLSPRHSGYHRVATIGNVTLREFIDKKPVAADFAMQASRSAMQELGFVAPTNKRDYRPNAERGMTHSLLAIVWEMREKVHESISLGMVFNELMAEFQPAVRDLALSERKSTVELMDPFVFSFFSILMQVVARTPLAADEGESVSMLELQYFSNTPAHTELYQKWEQIFAKQQAAIPEELAHLRDPVVPGTPLDGALFQCILERSYIHTLSDRKKQQLKQAMWHIGNVLKVLTNCAHIEDKYVRVAAFIFRNAFNKLRYLNAELIRGIVQFSSVCDPDQERRTEKETGFLAPMPKEAELWTDLDAAPWAQAAKRVVSQAQDALARGTVAGVEQLPVYVQEVADQFVALLPQDRDLLLVAATFNPADKTPAQRAKVLAALRACSFVSSASSAVKTKPAAIEADWLPMLRLVCALAWFCTTLQPSQSNWFAAYLSALHDEDVVSEGCVRAWFATLGAAELQVFAPDAEDALTEDKLARLRKNCEPFIKWLDEQDEEDDDEEDEDEDEEA